MAILIRSNKYYASCNVGVFLTVNRMLQKELHSLCEVGVNKIKRFGKSKHKMHLTMLISNSIVQLKIQKHDTVRVIRSLP